MNQESISFFDSTGRITSTLKADAGTIQANKDHFAGQWVAGEFYDTDHYVYSGAVMPRPYNPASLTGKVLTDLPVPSTIYVNGQPYDCLEPTVELEFDQPGTYRVRVECWPYLDKEFTVEN